MGNFTKNKVKNIKKKILILYTSIPFVFLKKNKIEKNKISYPFIITIITIKPLLIIFIKNRNSFYYFIVIANFRKDYLIYHPYPFIKKSNRKIDISIKKKNYNYNYNQIYVVL